MPQFTRRSGIFITRAIRFAAPEPINRISGRCLAVTGQLNARHVLIPAPTIHIERWSRWQSQEAGPAIFTCCGPGERSQEMLDRPLLANVPAMQRRRLSSLARVVFQVLEFCADTDTEEPVVFSSEMGEIQRTQSLLETIARQEPISPTAFSLSVHNAIGGLWSQIKNIRAPMLALAPCADSPVPALLEAAGLLADGHYEAINVVFAQESYPDFYQPWLTSPPGPCALALRLTDAPSLQTSGMSLSLRRMERPAEQDSGHDNSAVLCRLLDEEVASAIVHEPRCDWLLERV